jgi:hypothetical protein
MPKLKEIAPMLLAGLAGAASPRGAQVFHNIAQSERQRKDDEQRERENEKRMQWAAEAANRAKGKESREIERHQGTVKYNELRIAEQERLAAEGKEEREALGKFKETVLENYSDLFAQKPERIIAIQEAESIPEAEEMLEIYGMPTPTELVEKTKEISAQYAEQGLGAQFDRYGNVVNVYQLKREKQEPDHSGFDAADAVTDHQIKVRRLGREKQKQIREANQWRQQLNENLLPDERKKIEDNIEAAEEAAVQTDEDIDQERAVLATTLGRLGRPEMYEELYPPAPTVENPVDWGAYTDAGGPAPAAEGGGGGIQVGELHDKLNAKESPKAPAPQRTPNR